ncbi:hypothetical protein CVV67_10965 [Arthrobacter stackebrandtii]|nr:hypothetical protein CVV67_10965 [Arthrobacter stackebrandtii]
MAADENSGASPKIQSALPEVLEESP